jgi:hypothetical protein
MHPIQFQYPNNAHLNLTHTYIWCMDILFRDQLTVKYIQLYSLKQYHFVTAIMNNDPCKGHYSKPDTCLISVIISVFTRAASLDRTDKVFLYRRPRLLVWCIRTFCNFVA